MSEFEVEIQDEYGLTDFPTQRVTNAIKYVLTRENAPDGAALTVVLTDNEQVQRLNAQYREVDAPTDVLSFPADPLPEEIEDEPPYLGDLLIACPYTTHQAEESGHALDDEFVLLVIHGTLHLLGYDHDNAAHEESMWAKQQDALRAAGVNFEVPRFTFGDEPSA
jgi:probable rRNA maturation factor